MKRTQPHRSYAEPSRLEIQNCFSEIGFKGAYSHDFVRDIANAISFSQAGESLDGCLLDVLAQMPPKPTINKNAAQSEQLLQGGELEQWLKSVKYHTNVQAFVKSLDFSAYAGNTPIQKAASVIATLSSQDGGKPSDSDGEALPIFLESSPEEVEEKAKKMEEDMEAFVEANKSIAKYLINPEEKCAAVAMAELSSRQKDLITKLSLIGSRGKIKSRVTSPTKKVGQMTEYSQVSRLSNLTSLALPTFAYKLATKQLTVMEPKQSSKQLVVFLIDNSSSMNSTGKRAWVEALMVDRLNGVAKGASELFVGWFERDVDTKNIMHISTKAQAIEFLKKGFFGSFSGNATNVQKAVETVAKSIESGKIGEVHLKGECPQIVVINDGEDSVNENFKPSVTTHGFILGQDNAGMKSMIENCGGHYERFM